MKDMFKQALGFINSAISNAGRSQDIADRAAARGDSATASRYRGKADAQITRAKATIANQIKKL